MPIAKSATNVALLCVGLLSKGEGVGAVYCLVGVHCVHFKSARQFSLLCCQLCGMDQYPSDLRCELPSGEAAGR